MILHLTRDELADFPVGSVVTVRGKEIQLEDTVETARRVLGSGAASVLPVLDGERYVGAVDRDTLAAAGGGTVMVRELVSDLVPVARSTTRTREALEELDRDGGHRLVVVGDDGRYVGLVCLRTDRNRLCVDAECLDL